MSATVIERTILANQYLILKALYPEDEQRYEEAYDAVMCGYENHYVSEGVYTGDSIMTPEECDEVTDILNMHRVLMFSYRGLQDREGTDERNIAFRGFDGNDETECKYMSYAEFYCRHNGGRFNEIDRSQGFNSHWPMLERYRTMMRRWNAMGRPRSLNREQITELISI